MTTYNPVFVDVESTGLNPSVHAAWEIAVIYRNGDTDTEHVFRVEPDLTNADPKGLEINRYHERTAAPDWRWDDAKTTAVRLQGLLRGTILVGSNPSFDAGMISALIGRHHPQHSINPAPWYHHTVDIATLAAGYIHGFLNGRSAGGGAPQPPYRSYEMSRAVGVEPPAGGAAHTALGDAAWARDVYDAVTRAGAVSG